MKLSNGKLWKDLLQISVKAVLTRSLISGRITAKPGFHDTFIKRSNIRSEKEKPKFNIITGVVVLTFRHFKIKAVRPGLRGIIFSNSDGIERLHYSFTPASAFNVRLMKNYTVGQLQRRPLISVLESDNSLSRGHGSFRTKFRFGILQDVSNH